MCNFLIHLLNFIKMKHLFFVLTFMLVSSVAFASVEKPSNKTKKQTTEEVEIVPEKSAVNYSNLVATLETVTRVNQAVDFARCKISDGVFRARGNCQQVLDAYARWLSMKEKE
jgi:hypothetical protein